MEQQENGKENFGNKVQVKIETGDLRKNQSDDIEIEEFVIDETDLNKDKDVNRNGIVYGIDEHPPWPTLFMLSTQLFLAVFSGILATPLILSSFICIDSDKIGLSEVIGTNFLVSGLITFLQSTFGCRLAMVQGGSAAFLLPAIAIMRFKEDCPTPLTANSTAEQHEMITTEWKSRMCELQGATVLASLTQFIIGFSGACGLLMRFIGPLTIGSTISLIGLSLFPVALDIASAQWGIAALTTFQIIIYSQILERFNIPCPRGRRVSIFRFFPVLIAIVVSWSVCGVLTAANVLPQEYGAYGYEARTDTSSDAVGNAPWFLIPYPGQWGKLNVTLAGYLGMLAGALASITESIGDYQACARISGAPPLPSHAINRGIGIEGFGCIIAGLLGSGNGSTTYSQGIAIIGLTKTSSRIVAQGAGVLLFLVGIFGKFNVVFSTIPRPIVGGVVIVTMCIDLVDQLLKVTLGTSMFIGGLTACILDNLIPGSRKERGMQSWQEPNEDNIQTSGKDTKDDTSCYDLPFGMKYINSWKWTRYVPVSPTFAGFRFKRKGYSRIRKTFKLRT